MSLVGPLARVGRPPFVCVVLMVAVVGGVGPFAGTIGFVYAERRAVSPAGTLQRDMV